MKRRYQYLHPFSHQVGSFCLIPKSFYVVQAFPSKIRVFKLEDLKNAIKEIDLPVTTRLDHFTLQQDLESCCVHIFSEKFSFYLTSDLEIRKKRPRKEVEFERVCFGVTKKQEMERIYARKDVQEIFPIWFRLGQMIELPLLEEKEGIFSLVEACKDAINKGNRDEILPALMTLFQAGFHGIFLPKTEDELWQNLFVPAVVKSSPLYLLQEGYKLIRQLFFSEEEDRLKFLPHLPSKLPHGRAYDLKWKGGRVHIEWSKHKLRKVIFLVEDAQELLLDLSDISSFRLNFMDRKKRNFLVGEPLHLPKKGMYVLDRFVR